MKHRDPMQYITIVDGISVVVGDITDVKLLQNLVCREIDRVEYSLACADELKEVLADDSENFTRVAGEPRTSHCLVSGCTEDHK